jgi:hypothetical protein
MCMCSRHQQEQLSQRVSCICSMLAVQLCGAQRVEKLLLPVCLLRLELASMCLAAVVPPVTTKLTGCSSMPCAVTMTLIAVPPTLCLCVHQCCSRS